jgi:hypothetical protein
MKRNIYLLLAVFLLMLAAAAHPWWGGRIGIGKKAPAKPLSFDDFKLETTEKIVIKQGEEEKVLQKDKSGWRIEDFRASGTEVDAFFRSLENLEIETLASKNPDNHQNFSLAGADAYYLTLKTSDQEKTFVVGKPGPQPQSFYIKAEGADRAYLATGSLRGFLLKNVDGWRDKIVLSVSKDKVDKIETVSPAQTLSLQKDQKGNWSAKTAGGETKVEKAVIDNLFASLSPLAASGFLDEKQKGEFDRASNKTVLRLWEGGQLSAEMKLLKKDTEWWARVKGRDDYFIIPASALEKVILKPKDLSP